MVVVHACLLHWYKLLQVVQGHLDAGLSVLEYLDSHMLICSFKLVVVDVGIIITHALLLNLCNPLQHLLVHTLVI